MFNSNDYYQNEIVNQLEQVRDLLKNYINIKLSYLIWSLKKFPLTSNQK